MPAGRLSRVLKNLGLVWAQEACHLPYLGLWPFASFLTPGTKRLSSDNVCKCFEIFLQRV